MKNYPACKEHKFYDMIMALIIEWDTDIRSSLVLVQPRKTRPCLTERLLMGRKESNQTNKHRHKIDRQNIDMRKHWKFKRLTQQLIENNNDKTLTNIDTFIFIPVIHLQFWTYGSWDSLFPISMSPTANLWVQGPVSSKHLRRVFVSKMS